MKGFYLQVFSLFPESIKRRINPLQYAVDAFVCSGVTGDPKAVVLDAGAGEGRYREALCHYRYLALDSTRGDSSWDYSRLDVIGDLIKLPLASEHVDFVVNTQVLEHVSDPLQVLQELQRVLKAGGTLLLTAPQGWHEHQQPNDFYRFTRYSLQRLLGDAGFTSFEVSPMGGYFHYLGHRLTYVPKVLFQENVGWKRVILFPIELLSLFLFCFLGPLLCFYLDRCDRTKDFTLCYQCKAVK
jgi:SAM-dependent methyltransferase